MDPIGVRGVEVITTSLAFPVLRSDGTCQTIGAQPGFPPPQLIAREVKDAILPPSDRAACENTPYALVGVRLASGNATGLIEGLRLVYEHDGVMYEVFLPYSLTFDG